MNIEIRRFDTNAIGQILHVLAETMTADAIDLGRFTQKVLLDHNFRAAGAPVAIADGKVVGFCLGIARQTPLENAPSDSERGYITLLGVLPAYQRRGIGTKLLAAAEEYLLGQGRTMVMVSSYAPNYFIPGVDVNAYAAAMSFFQKHGYVEVYRPLAMQTSLWDLQVPPWVGERRKKLAEEKVFVSPFISGLALPLIEFARKEFPGDWVRVARETVGKILTGDSPMRLMVAYDKDQVVGFSHYENERFGPIGVAQSQRGRGVGQVLMYMTLDAQRQAGFRAAWFLWSDDKTAERIYNGAGFKETRRFALMKKGLA
jgi:GNAT superfamily N-acetyltransferase